MSIRYWGELSDGQRGELRGLMEWLPDPRVYWPGYDVLREQLAGIQPIVDSLVAQVQEKLSNKWGIEQGSAIGEGAL